MFDFSFFELAVIGGVALIVIGPERLPQVARTVGKWVGKVQRYVADVKNDLNREMEFEELRRLRAEMNETARSVEATARSMENSLRQQAEALAGAPGSTSSPADAVAAVGHDAMAAVAPAASTPDVAEAEASVARPTGSPMAPAAAAAPEARPAAAAATPPAAPPSQPTSGAS